MKTEFATVTTLPASPNEADIKKFHEDIRFGRTAGFEAFLDKFGASGVKATLPDSGTLPLMTAAWWGRIDMTAELLERGADIEGRDDKGHTPLMAAAWSNRTDVVRLLLDRGADIEARNNAGTTPVIFAIYEDGVETLQELLRRGANPEAASDNGWTALMQAAVNGKTRIAMILFNRGVDVDAQNAEGKNALDYARMYNREETLAALGDAIQARDEAFVENEIRNFRQRATQGTPAPVAVKRPLRLKTPAA